MGLDRGIFGVTSVKKQAIHSLLTQLETENEHKHPVDQLETLVDGSWLLLYSDIVISGVKRSKLGLREFVKLGSFIQTIDSKEGLAINKIGFSVTGLGLVKGSLSIVASFERESSSRVRIELKGATLVPSELQKLFEANYDLLLSVFNPSGFLELTYVDEKHRIGRDDKGNVFYLIREGVA